MEIKSTRDLHAGMRIGKVVLLERSVEYPDRENKPQYCYGVWTAKCDCGEVFTRRASSFVQGRDTTSCDKCRHWQVKDSGTDGDGSLKSKYNRLYQMWQNIHGRCEKLNYFEYKEYGGRGIKVCDEWSKYIPFKKWAIANGWDPDAPVRSQTIDRIDVNGNYSPDNCRFLDVKGQSNNRRTNVSIEYHGKKQTLAQWSEELGLGYNTLTARYRSGKTGDELFAPTRKQSGNAWENRTPTLVLIEGKKMTVIEASEHLGVSGVTIRRRIKSGKLQQAS